MSTSININDHDALDAAFAEKVAGWIKYEAPRTGGGLLLPYTHFDGDGMPRIGVAPFTRSMDAVLPWLEKHSRDTGEARGGEPEVFRIDSPADAKDLWRVVMFCLHHDGEILETAAAAPTLPHAAVVALLRANGVTVEEDKP